MKVDKYNKQRKKLLQKLDEGITPPIIELGMYDLTPYFKDEFDVSLTEAIMLNRNLERKIEHIEQDFYFSPPQANALEVLSQYNKIILSAPTSFGKTLLVKEFIFKHKPKNIVYVVPTNALAYELEKSFKNNRNFSDYVIFDRCSDVSLMDSKNIYENSLLFIGTQEKYLELDNGVFSEIDLFVIDEAYKLEETMFQQRGYKLSETFLESINRKAIKIFLITPQAKFIGFDKYEFFLFETNFNAVEKNFEVLNKNEFWNALLEKSKTEKSILFCASPMQINATYTHLKDSLIEIPERIALINFLEKDIHPDWSVIKLLKAGILTHHGQMPKYIQNKMINIFNNSDNYNMLLGTNSISEGINTVTKNLFIHPDYGNFRNILLIKNTIGRAGRLGEYPIGHIYSTIQIEDMLEQEIEIELSISKDVELAELENSKNDEKILEFSNANNIDFNFSKTILNKYKFSLTKLNNILSILKEDVHYSSITNLPFMSKKVFFKEYMTNPDNDLILIKGYLQDFYIENNQNKSLNSFDDRILFYKKIKKEKQNVDIYDNSEVINLYMQFIYSTLEYYILPLVNVGLDIKTSFPDWKFGENVLETLEDCLKKYYKKTFGGLDVKNLSESHVKIISTLKDYGISSSIKKLNIEILEEINKQLNVRYSTIDVLNAINYLALNSLNNKSFFAEIKRNYID